MRRRGASADLMPNCGPLQHLSSILSKTCPVLVAPGKSFFCFAANKLPTDRETESAWLSASESLEHGQDWRRCTGRHSFQSETVVLISKKTPSLRPLSVQCPVRLGRWYGRSGACLLDRRRPLYRSARSGGRGAAMWGLRGDCPDVGSRLAMVGVLRRGVWTGWAAVSQNVQRPCYPNLPYLKFLGWKPGSRQSRRG